MGGPARPGKVSYLTTLCARSMPIKVYNSFWRMPCAVMSTSAAKVRSEIFVARSLAGSVAAAAATTTAETGVLQVAMVEPPVGIRICPVEAREQRPHHQWPRSDHPAQKLNRSHMPMPSVMPLNPNSKWLLQALLTSFASQLTPIQRRQS